MKCVVAGSGSWGTGLAQVLCDNGRDVTIWGICEDEKYVATICSRRI